MNTELPHLKELVKRESLSGHEEAVSSYVAEQCDSYGLTVEMVGLNVVAHAPGHDRTKAFILNGHMDTVSAIDSWNSDPFALTDNSDDPDKLHGLGASDMKAGLAIMLDIAKDLGETTPACDTWLIFTTKEEVDNEGAKQTAEWFAQTQLKKYKTTGGLILEPTGAEFVGAGERNGLILKVTAEGAGGHGSQDFGTSLNAIGKVGGFAAALPGIQTDWQALYTHKTLGKPTLNSTKIRDGGSGEHNIVPGTCELTVDMRTTPELDANLDVIIEKLEDKYDVKIVSPWPPTDTVCPPESHIYKVTQDVLGTDSLTAFPGTTDLFAFLEHGIPFLVYGPGAIDAMHQPDEWVRLSAIKKCGEGVRRIMQRY